MEKTLFPLKTQKEVWEDRLRRVDAMIERLLKPSSKNIIIIVDDDDDDRFSVVSLPYTHAQEMREFLERQKMRIESEHDIILKNSENETGGH